MYFLTVPHVFKSERPRAPKEAWPCIRYCFLIVILEVHSHSPLATLFLPVSLIIESLMVLSWEPLAILFLL